MFLWDDASGGNVEHCAEHGLTIEEVESAFDHIELQTVSRSSGKPAIFGRTINDEVIFVVYELDADNDGEEFVYVITAYAAEEEG